MLVALLHRAHQLQDGRLHGNILPRDDLVADDQSRPGHEGARDGHALLLPAAQLVRVAVASTPGRAALRPAPPRPARRARAAPMSGRNKLDRSAHERAHRVPGVERRVRILEDDLDGAALLARFGARPDRGVRPRVGSPRARPGPARRSPGPIVDLPLPLSPTSATTSPGADAERHVAHGLDPGRRRGRSCTQSRRSRRAVAFSARHDQRGRRVCAASRASAGLPSIRNSAAR